MAAPSGFQPNIVAFAVQVLFLLDQRVAVRAPVVGPTVVWGRLAILRMKIKRVQGQRLGVSTIIDVEIEIADSLRSLVGNGNARVFLEWHGKEAVQSLVRSHRQRNRLIKKIVAQAEPEEIPDGRFHAG